VVLVLFDPGRFAGAAHFRAEVTDLVANVRGSPAKPGATVQLPGDPERRGGGEPRRGGLPNGAGAWGEVRALGVRGGAGGLGEPRRTGAELRRVDRISYAFSGTGVMRKHLGHWAISPACCRGTSTSLWQYAQVKLTASRPPAI